MATRVVKNDDKTVTLEVTLDGDVWKSARDAAFEKIRKSMNIKGFRKGHVPAAMAKKLISAEGVNEQAAYDAAQNALISGLDETKIEFVESPVLDIREAGKDKAVLTFTGEVYPEAELGQYKGFGIKKEEETVTDEDVDNAVKEQAKRKADLVVVEDESPAENGETVTIDFVGKMDGEPFEGGSAEDFKLMLGSHRMIEGFEEQIEGMKTGETKEITVTFPENYQAANLAGKEAQFDITVKEIEKEVLPEINDEFAASLELEDVKTLDELKDHIRKQLQAAKDEQAEDAFTQAVLEKAVENAKVDIPSALVDREVDNMLQMMINQIRQSGMDPQMYFQVMNQHPEELKESMRPEAVARLTNTLVLDAIAKAEDLTVSDEDVERELKVLAENFGMDVDKVRGLVQRDMIEDDLLRDAALDVLRNNQ